MKNNAIICSDNDDNAYVISEDENVLSLTSFIEIYFINKKDFDYVLSFIKTVMGYDRIKELIKTTAPDDFFTIIDSIEKIIKPCYKELKQDGIHNSISLILEKHEEFLKEK